MSRINELREKESQLANRLDELNWLTSNGQGGKAALAELRAVMTRLRKVRKAIENELSQ